MSAQPPNPDEIVARGRAIYAQHIRPRLEPAHNGEFVVINVESGEYELDADDVRAAVRAAARFGSAPVFTLRVGHAAAYRLGGRFRTERAG